MDRFSSAKMTCGHFCAITKINAEPKTEEKNGSFIEYRWNPDLVNERRRHQIRLSPKLCLCIRFVRRCATMQRDQSTDENTWCEPFRNSSELCEILFTIFYRRSDDDHSHRNGVSNIRFFLLWSRVARQQWNDFSLTDIFDRFTCRRCVAVLWRRSRRRFLCKSDEKKEEEMRWRHLHD